jgi:hypothetical protein
MYCTTSTSTGFWNKKKSRRPTLSLVMMKMEPTTAQVNGSRFSASLATPTRNSYKPKSIESSSMLIAAPLPTYWSRSCVDQERDITCCTKQMKRAFVAQSCKDRFIAVVNKSGSSFGYNVIACNAIAAFEQLS